MIPKESIRIRHSLHLNSFSFAPQSSAASRGGAFFYRFQAEDPPTSQYVRTVRLILARKMIEEGQENISEIAYSVGFSSPTYFSRCFKEEYGYPPSDVSN